MMIAVPTHTTMINTATPPATNPMFTRRLRSTGFDVEEVKVRANGPRGGAKHIVWIAT